MRITSRDMNLLKKLRVARWLSTRQVSELCFPGLSLEMARRRLRLLRGEKYVRSCQSNSMAEAMHTLGLAGRDLLRIDASTSFRLERTPPKNLEHFTGINDIRISLERCAAQEGFEISFFFSCWELQQQNWPYRLIPDAACELRKGDSAPATVLFEYDRGEESVGYVIRTKFKPYSGGLQGFPFVKVIVIADLEARLEQLRTAAEAYLETGLFGFVLLRQIRKTKEFIAQLPLEQNSSQKVSKNPSMCRPTN